LVGLRVKRVDLLHGRITVAVQATEINGQFIWGPPKTEAGRRTVTCRRWRPPPGRAPEHL
jgi:hypothetical protein